MNPWFENSGRVPTHSTGILYKTVTPNKKHEVLHKNPEVEAERSGQWYSWIRAERNAPWVFVKMLSIPGKGWCFIKDGIRGLESDTFFFFFCPCQEMKWNSMRIFKWLLKPLDVMCRSEHPFCLLLQEWARLRLLQEQ